MRKGMKIKETEECGGETEKGERREDEEEE